MQKNSECVSSASHALSRRHALTLGVSGLSVCALLSADSEAHAQQVPPGQVADFLKRPTFGSDSMLLMTYLTHEIYLSVVENSLDELTLSLEQYKVLLVRLEEAVDKILRLVGRMKVASAPSVRQSLRDIRSHSLQLSALETDKADVVLAQVGFVLASIHEMRAGAYELKETITDDEWRRLRPILEEIILLVKGDPNAPEKSVERQGLVGLRKLIEGAREHYTAIQQEATAEIEELTSVMRQAAIAIADTEYSNPAWRPDANALLGRAYEIAGKLGLRLGILPANATIGTVRNPYRAQPNPNEADRPGRLAFYTVFYGIVGCFNWFNGIGTQKWASKLLARTDKTSRMRPAEFVLTPLEEERGNNAPRVAGFPEETLGQKINRILREECNRDLVHTPVTKIQYMDIVLCLNADVLPFLSASWHIRMAAKALMRSGLCSSEAAYRAVQRLLQN